MIYAQHFDAEEFREWSDDMSARLVTMLDVLRFKLGSPIRIRTNHSDRRHTMRFLLALAFMLTATTATAQDFYLNYQAAYSPPGGDIIAGNKIARYVVELEPEVTYGWATFKVKAQAYSVNTWITSEKRGSGFDKFKGSYAWDVEEWRYALTPRLEFGNPKLKFFIENYSPVDRHGDWNEGGAHGQETEFYWLLGVSGRMKF